MGAGGVTVLQGEMGNEDTVGTGGLSVFHYTAFAMLIWSYMTILKYLVILIRAAVRLNSDFNRQL